MKTERITLPDVTIDKTPAGLLVTHIKTGATVTVSIDSLQRWLISKLRAIF